MRIDQLIQGLLLAVLAAAPAIPEGVRADLRARSAQEPRTPPQAQSLFDQGLKDFQHARYEQAIEAFRRALALDPSLLTARYDLGVAYFALERFKESRIAFDELRKRAPQHRFAIYFLARIDLVEGNLDAAIRGFEALSGTKPLADELYYLGSAYLRRGNTRDAARALERAAAARPEDYRVHLLLARAYEKSSRLEDSAAQYVLSEKLRETYRAKSREILECNSLLLSQPIDAAVERCRKLLDGDDPTKLVSLGVLLAGKQLYDQAVLPLEKASRLDPENYEPQFNLGLTYFKMKNYREARKPLEAAVALRPESYDAVALLGSTLFALGKDYPAAKHLRHAHRLRPEDEKIADLLFAELKIIAQHSFAGGNYRESVPYFEEALALKPDAGELRQQLAEAYGALGQEEKAASERQAPGKQP